MTVPQPDYSQIQTFDDWLQNFDPRTRLVMYAAALTAMQESPVPSPGQAPVIPAPLAQVVAQAFGIEGNGLPRDEWLFHILRDASEGPDSGLQVFGEMITPSAPGAISQHMDAVDMGLLAELQRDAPELVELLREGVREVTKLGNGPTSPYGQTVRQHVWYATDESGQLPQQSWTQDWLDFGIMALTASGWTGATTNAVGGAASTWTMSQAAGKGAIKSGLGAAGGAATGALGGAWSGTAGLGGAGIKQAWAMTLGKLMKKPPSKLVDMLAWVGRFEKSRKFVSNTAKGIAGFGVLSVQGQRLEVYGRMVSGFTAADGAEMDRVLAAGEYAVASLAAEDSGEPFPGLFELGERIAARVGESIIQNTTPEQRSAALMEGAGAPGGEMEMQGGSTQSGGVESDTEGGNFADKYMQQGAPKYVEGSSAEDEDRPTREERDPLIGVPEGWVPGTGMVDMTSVAKFRDVAGGPPLQSSQSLYRESNLWGITARLSGPQLANVIRKMAVAGFLDQNDLGPTAGLPAWSPAVQNAMANLMATANLNGQTWEEVLDDTYQKGLKMREENRRKAIAEFTFGPYLAPDYASMASDAEALFSARVGRKPTDAELTLLVNQMDKSHNERIDQERELDRQEQMKILDAEDEALKLQITDEEAQEIERKKNVVRAQGGVIPGDEEEEPDEGLVIRDVDPNARIDQMIKDRWSGEIARNDAAPGAKAGLMGALQVINRVENM